MKQTITIQAEGVTLPAIDAALLERWIDAVVQSHGKVRGQLGYVFCNDDRILEVNREFLNHDYYTDIITFDYCIGRLVRGDMYISLETVLTNAEAVGATYGRELRRVIIHGVLHLCGIDDKAPGARAIMECHENAALAILDSLEEEVGKSLIVKD